MIHATDEPGGQPDKKAPQLTVVLDPQLRVSEIVFGVLTALMFTGSLNVAAAGSQEIETMLAAAFGCNLAWGIADAAMYVVGMAIERRRRIGLWRRLQATCDDQEAHRLIVEALPERIGAALDAEALEVLRTRLLIAPTPAVGLEIRDYLGGLAVFVLVVVGTFPVVIPFLVFYETPAALRVSNAVSLATLFVGGCFLGHYAGGSPWRYGMALSALGFVLVVIMIALGG